MLFLFSRFYLGLLVLAALFTPPANAAGLLHVFVGIDPVRYLVERVGGDRIDVTVVVKSNQSPETYEPSPRQIAALAEADAFFGVGMPLEDAWRRQLRTVAAGSPLWLDLSAGLGGEVEHQDSGASSDSHEHGEIDPHVWLSPGYARHMTGMIRDELIRLDPAGEAYFEQRAAALDRELEALDGEITEILRASGVRTFLVYHPAWGHFARDYGLEQISIESGGKEPGPREMIDVINRAREAGIGTVFIDPRHSRRLAETVAEAIGADIQILDPLSSDYLANLRRAARAIAGSV